MKISKEDRDKILAEFQEDYELRDDSPYESLEIVLNRYVTAEDENQIAKRKMREFMDYCKEHFSDKAWFSFVLETSQFIQAWEEYLDRRE
jgi:hypothetical protein